MQYSFLELNSQISNLKKNQLCKNFGQPGYKEGPPLKSISIQNVQNFHPKKVHAGTWQTQIGNYGLK